MVVLAGEIGKETSKLGIFSHQTVSKHTNIENLLKSQTFPTKNYANGLHKMIEEFLDENYHGKISEDIYGACFGIAAPVEKESSATITYQHELQAKLTVQEFRLTLPYNTVPVFFLNDMEAIGYGIFLGDGEDKLEPLHRADYKPAPQDCRVLMLVSGGLGQALWYWDEKKGALHPIPSEGGHTDFGARIDRDIELLRYLKEQKEKKGDHSPVSYEYVLSIPGLVRIYAFLQNIPEDDSDKDALPIFR